MKTSKNYVIGAFIAIIIFGMLLSSATYAGDMIQIVFFAVWMLSVILGLTAGKAGRPAAGFLMIVMTIFVFSFTATGVMGQAVFGYWWPQVESGVEAITAPLGPIWDQATSGMSDSWLMLTNPMGYYDIMAKRQQATKTVVKEGGTVKSIELTRTDLFTSVPGQLEPILDPLIGSFEIQNQGEFEAKGIELKLWASWQDPTKTTISGQPNPSIHTGSLSKFNCSIPNTAPPFTSGSQVGTCKWDATTYPQEIRVVNFMFEKNSWGLGTSGNLADCVYNGSASDCSNPDATYSHSGQTVKVNVNLTYDYNVNVSIPVDVINFNVYQTLLQAKEITFQELTSQYTGGPVKATLWSQRQPIRSGESSLFVASIYNDGQGEITSVGFTIYILSSLGKAEKISSTFYNGKIGTDGCGDVSPSSYGYPGAYNTITCIHNLPNRPIKPGEYVRVSFLITPPEDLGVDRISRLIVGLANYEYVKTASKSITIANNPWH